MLQGGKRYNELKNNSPLVSVICVTFNAAATLSQMLFSYNKLKSAGTELIIIDGNSTDGTLNILRENDGLIDLWISEQDDGIYDAMNKALNYVYGKWIIFIGADDELEAGFNQVLPDLKEPGTIYYGNVIYYDKELSRKYDDYYLTKLNFCHQAMFYPNAVFNKFSYYTKYKVYADYYLNLQCWKDADFKFVHLNYLVARFNHGGYSSFNEDEVFIAERAELFRKFLKPISYYRYLNRTEGFWAMLKKMAAFK